MKPEVSDYDRARKLLDIYRGEVDDFFKLWPPDKLFYFSKDKKAFISYGVRRNVAICMGDPAGAEHSIKLLLKDFGEFCSEHQLKPAFIQTTDKYRESYTAVGLRSVLIGADAVINLDDFTLNTIHNKYFRNLVNRYHKNHFSFETSLPPHNKKLLAELKNVSDSWLTLPHRKEWSFLTGRLNTEYLQQVTLYVLRDGKGKAQAFANEIPSFKPGIVTIDLMRHRSDAPTNSIDILFIQLLQLKNKDGYTAFNLGLSPLDGKPFVSGLAAKTLIYLYRLSNRFIGFNGLHQFKAKYKPIWEPRFVWYQDGRRNLIPIGIAVIKLLNGS